MLTTIINLLNEILLPEPPLTEADMDVPLRERGMTSLPFIRFILVLEEEFDFEVLDSDLLTDNFATISKTMETLKKYEIR